MTRPLVLFDFGGTLNSNGDHWGALFRKMGQRLFPDRSIEELESAYISSERRLSSDGLTSESFPQTLALQIGYQFEALGVSAADVLDIEVDRFSEIAADRIGRFSSLLELMNPIADSGIVSNFYGNIGSVCDAYGLTSKLSVVVDSACVGLRKPNSAIWTYAMDLADRKPASTIVVGDSHKNDIHPARTLGCRTVWCRGLEWRPFSGASEADIEVCDYQELVAALEKLLETKFTN